MPTKPIYFDTAATTAVAPEVIDAMLACLGEAGAYANPASSIHALGRAAAAKVEAARVDVAREFGCDPDEVIFTAGATESINIALRGLLLGPAAAQQPGRHLITSAIEHKATLACASLLEHNGVDVTYLAPEPDGAIDPARLAEAIRPDTLLISILHTNNETGVIQPIDAIARIAAEQCILLHVDAAQAAGKLRIDFRRTQIDLLSLSAHKFHGPKGVGCLVVRNRHEMPIEAVLVGGSQEFGLRPGTQPTHQITGLAAALRLAAERRDADLAHVEALKAAFVDQLSAALPIRLHGDPTKTSPYIINLSIPNIRADALINQTAAEIAIASTSACSSGTVAPSHVLSAMGIDSEDLRGAVRISFDRGHQPADIDTAVTAIIAAVERIRALG
jgi:cysteine desulfurase